MASSQEGCDHFCLSSHFSMMYSHESITNSDSESPDEGLNVVQSDCEISGNISFYNTILVICCI